jgi:hypothetical protein
MTQTRCLRTLLDRAPFNPVFFEAAPPDWKRSWPRPCQEHIVIALGRRSLSVPASDNGAPTGSWMKKDFGFGLVGRVRSSRMWTSLPERFGDSVQHARVVI